MQIQAEPEQLLYHQYGVIWLYYIQKPKSQDINGKILKVYHELDIKLQRGVLSNSDQIHKAFSSHQIERTQCIKLAIIEKKILKQSRQALKQIIKRKKIMQIRYEQNQIDSVLNQSFGQMRSYTNHLNLESILHSVHYENTFMELLTLYASVNDNISEQKSFLEIYKKLFEEFPLSSKPEIMQKFMINQTFRSYLQIKMNQIDYLNTSVEIGFVVRKLFQLIKEKSNDQHKIGKQKVKQYKKLIRWNASNLNYLKKNSIYYMNTFHPFHIFKNAQSFNPTRQFNCPQNKKSVFAIITINTQSQQSNMINNGIYQINNEAYFNCLNYFQFIKLTRLDLKNQQCDFCCYQLEFRMITKQYWEKSLCNINDNDQVTLLHQVFRFLQQKKQNVTFEDVYIYTRNFTKTQFILSKRLQKKMEVNNQYCEKIGLLPVVLTEHKIRNTCSLIQAAENYKNAKGFEKYYSLTIALQKEIQLLSKHQIAHLFNKQSIELNRKKLQLLLIKNEIPHNKQNPNSLLDQIYEDIKQYAGMLSHRNISQIHKVQQPQRGCFSCFYKERTLSKQQIISKNDQILQQHLFNEKGPSHQEKQLKQLKQQLIKLFQSFQKAVIDKNRFVNNDKHFSAFYQKFNRDKQLKEDIQIIKSSKIKSRNDQIDEDNNIQTFLSKKESEISTLQSQLQNFSKIFKSSHKFMRGESLNNTSMSLRDSKSSLQENKKKIKKISIQLQKKLEEIQSNLSETNSRQYREASKLYIKNLLISIEVLKEQNHSVNSIVLIELYRKLAQAYLKTGNIVQLQNLTKIQLFQEYHSMKLHSMILKTQLHSLLATLAYNKNKLELSKTQIKKSIQLYQYLIDKMIEKGKQDNSPNNRQSEGESDRKYLQSINNKKIIDLKILSFKVLYSQLRISNDKEQKKKKVQQLFALLKNFAEQCKQKIGNERFKVYRIELVLLKIMAEQINIQIQQDLQRPPHQKAMNQQNSSKEMKLKNISRSLRLKQDIVKIYGKSLKYALIIIDIMIKRFNTQGISKQYNVEQYKADVQQNQSIIQQIFKMQQQRELRVKYYWVLQLARFFKERSNQTRLFKISQSRRLIQACLHEFKKIKLLDQMDIDLKRYYETIFALYQKFMKKYLNTFPIRQNILQSKQVNDDIPYKQLKTSPRSVEDPRYDHQIIWLFCINSKDYELHELQSIQFHQKQKLMKKNIQSCISGNLQLFFNNLIRLRDQGKYIIKGVIDSNLLQIYLKKYHKRDYITKRLKNVDKLYIIMKGKNKEEEIDIHFIKSKLGEKKIEIKEPNNFKYLLNQFQQNMIFQYETKRNTIFFVQKCQRQKITNYHTIIHACISHTVNQQLNRINSNSNIYIDNVRKFFEKVENVNVNIKDLSKIQSLLILKKQYEQCCTKLIESNMKQQIEFKDKQIKSIKQQMFEISQKVINIYTGDKIAGQNIFYDFINNNLRILYDNPETMVWQYIQPFVYILYHSILILSLKQHKQPQNRYQKSTKLWRKAEMKDQQYLNYSNIYSDQNKYIKHISFLSTSSSFQWIQKELLKSTNDDKSLSKFAIIQIQVDNAGYNQNQMMDNGFVTVPSKIQFETLFNILNVFMVTQVSKVRIDEIAPKGEPVLKDLMGKQIIYIKQKFIRNLSHLYESKQLNKPIQYFFNFQQQFNKQRSHYQKYQQAPHSLQSFRFSSYTLIQAYIDLGLLKKAEESIALELQRARNSPIQFIHSIFGNDQNPQNSKNLLHKLISIYMKRGQDKKAQTLFNEYDKQLKEIKKLISQQSEKRILTERTYDLKKEMIELFHEQLDIDKYQKKINEIQKQIQRLDRSAPHNMMKKSQQIIYLYLHRSIFYFQTNQMKLSLQFFKQTLQKIKEICVPSESFDKVKRYCENIIKCLRRLFGKYQSLNNNHFAEQIKAITTSFMEANESVNQKQQDRQYSDAQINLHCCEEFAQQIRLNEQYLTQSEISSIAQNIQIESQASDNINQKISQHIDLQDFKENIKYINWCLLGKVETQKQRVAKCSLTKMEEYMNTFQKIAEKLNAYQIQDLKSRGFTQQSIQLVRSKRKKARLALSKMNEQQFYNQIEIIFTYCRDRQSHKLEQCRTIILQAQFEQIKLQNELMAKNYKMQGSNEKRFNTIHQKLNSAREKLELAYLRSNRNFLSSMLNSEDDIKFKKPEYLAIMMLRVKVAYQQYFQTGSSDANRSKNRKELLHKALEQLEAAIANRQKSFNVLNEEIYLYNIKSQFSMLIIKDPKLFDESFTEFNKGLQKRQHFKGMNSIENAIDCIELLEIFDVFHDQSIISKVTKKERERLYLYVKEGARSSQNNTLFWRFIRCVFTRILRKSYKNDQDYILAKLQFIQKAVEQIKRLLLIDQLSIIKMEQTYNKFIQHSKQIKSVQTLENVEAKKREILKIITDIKNKNIKQNNEQQSNFSQSQLPQNSNKDRGQYQNEENSPKSKQKSHEYTNYLNRSEQKLLKSSQKYKQQQFNGEEFQPFHYSPIQLINQHGQIDLKEPL